jgi:hypothetical protein
MRGRGPISKHLYREMSNSLFSFKIRLLSCNDNTTWECLRLANELESSELVNLKHSQNECRSNLCTQLDSTCMVCAYSLDILKNVPYICTYPSILVGGFANSTWKHESISIIPCGMENINMKTSGQAYHQDHCFYAHSVFFETFETCWKRWCHPIHAEIKIQFLGRAW